MRLTSNDADSLISDTLVMPDILVERIAALNSSADPEDARRLAASIRIAPDSPTITNREFWTHVTDASSSILSGQEGHAFTFFDLHTIDNNKFHVMHNFQREIDGRTVSAGNVFYVNGLPIAASDVL